MAIEMTPPHIHKVITGLHGLPLSAMLSPYHDYTGSSPPTKFASHPALTALESREADAFPLFRVLVFHQSHSPSRPFFPVKARMTNSTGRQS